MKHLIVKAMLCVAQNYFWNLRLRDFRDKKCENKNCRTCVQFDASALPEIWHDNFDQVVGRLQSIFAEIDKDPNHPFRGRLSWHALFVPSTWRASMALLSPCRVFAWDNTTPFSKYFVLEVIHAANRMFGKTGVSQVVAGYVYDSPETVPWYLFEWVDFVCVYFPEHWSRLTPKLADTLREKRDRRYKAIMKVLVGELSLPLDVCRFIVLPYCSLW